MESSIVKNENATITVNCVAGSKEWKAAQAKGFQKVKAKLKLKGFRKGSEIPDELAKPHINQGDVFNEAINVILPDLYNEVLKANNVVPFMQPDVNVTKLTEKDLEVVFVIPVYPEVTLGDYKGIKVEKDDVKVTEDEVKASLNNLALQHADLTVSEPDHKANKGDTVVFDFDGYVDNKAFEGGSAKNYSLELGSNQFIPGFEDQLVGAKAGESVDVNVTFPTQYVKELAGKKALFKCLIHEVKTKLIPDLNDDFAASLGIEGVTTLEQLEAYQKEQIINVKERNASAKQYSLLVEKIVEGSKIEIGEKVLNREIDAMKQDLENRMQQNGLTLEQYLEITNLTEEQLNEQFKGEALKNLKTYLTLAKVAEVEKITVTDEDLDAELESMAKQYSMEVNKIKELLGNNIDRVRSEIQQRKIETFLKENNL